MQPASQEPLSNNVAVITGAGSGIGAATALSLAAGGWRVALAGRRESALQEVADQGAGLPGDLLAVPTDVTEEQSVVDLFERATSRFGRVDLLFNNAGMFSASKEPDEITLQEWNAIVAVNLTGAFLCAREAFRVMREQQPRGGRIINNGSISAHVPRVRSIGYTATKHAITGLTRSLSLDGRPYDIACGQIDIGNAATGLARFGDGMPQPDGSIRPEPSMDTAEAARAVVFMAGLPLNANVQFMTVMASAMPFIGRG